MALLLRQPRTTQPQGPAQIDWGNPIARGLEFAILPGLRHDSALKVGGVYSFGVGTSAFGASMSAPGTDRNNGIVLRSGQLLGPLQNSTVVAIARTTAAYLYGTNGVESDGLIGSSGNALYCERGSSGNDIYKLGLAGLGDTVPAVEFTYRNDGATLLQQRVTKLVNDGSSHFYAATKAGTSHSVFVDNLRSTGTFGSGSTAFTDASNQMRIGSDQGDAQASWNGFIDVVMGWSRALSDAEIKSLSDNPWQIFAPQARQIWVPTGGGAVNLAANASGLAAGTATLLKGVSLAGAALSVATATAGMSHLVPLSASAVGQVSSTGQLSLTIIFGATAVSSAVATALMSLGKPMAAAAAAQADGTAALSVAAGGSAVNLAAAAVSGAASGATLSLVVSLSAAAVAQASAWATLGGGVALAAAAIANAQASAAMAVGKPLDAAAVGLASSGANLWLDVQLGAHALASAVAGGALSLTVNLAAGSMGQASAAAALSKTITLAAGGVAIATGHADLMATGPIVGNAAFVARDARRTWTSAERRRPWAARSN